MSFVEKRGHCLCGSITYEAEVETHVEACHCGMCRRWGGAPFIGTKAARFHITTGADQLGRYQSSDWAERGFCSKCGTNLFYRFIPKDAYFLASGALEDETGLTMAREIFVDNAPGNYAFAGDHPRLTEAETMKMFEQAMQEVPA